MTRFNFAIGTSGTSGLVNVESLPVPCMVGIWNYKPATAQRIRGDRSAQDYGPAEIEWKQSVVTAAQRQQWRVYCPGPSAEIFIRSRVLDDSSYHNFKVTMYWPAPGDEPAPQARRVLGLDFRFSVIEAY